MRHHHKTISRPSNFILILATNPCPCGFYGSSVQSCTCSEFNRKKYLQRLSQPILDRIDLHIWVKENAVTDIKPQDRQQSQSQLKVIRNRVQQAHLIQHQRLQSTLHTTNGQLNFKELEQFCPLSKSAQQLLSTSTTQLKLTTRAYHKTIKVAQTIADLNQEKIITDQHIAEALQYRLNLS